MGYKRCLIHSNPASSLLIPCISSQSQCLEDGGVTYLRKKSQWKSISGPKYSLLYYSWPYVIINIIIPSCATHFIFYQPSVGIFALVDWLVGTFSSVIPVRLWLLHVSVSNYYKACKHQESPGSLTYLFQLKVIMVIR